MRVMPRPRRAEGERGLAIVLVALTVTVVLVFVAFAVDISAALGERRKSQNTVDAAALAGGLLLVDPGGRLVTPPEDVVAREIIDLAYENVRNDTALSDTNDLTPSEWSARFAACTDPDRDTSAFPVVSTLTPCISFNSRMTRARVRLPDLNVGTSFATVLGIDSLAVSADAEVELVPVARSGVLPFGLPGGSSGDSEICLKSKNQPSLPPCDGGENGQFGSVDISMYGNPVMGTPTECAGQTQNKLAVNIAIGIDHELGSYTSGSPVLDRRECPDLAATPNSILAQTGVGSSLDDGLIAGASVGGPTFPGRLTTGPWAVRRVRSGSQLDDRPLWAFIDPALTAADVPASCVPGTVTSKASMVRCLDDYKLAARTSTLPALLTADVDGVPGPDILRSPRFAWVPQLHVDSWGADPDASPQYYNIETFRPVFLQTAYFSCSNNAQGPAGCDGWFDPGEGGSFYVVGSTGAPSTRSLTANKTLEALTALLLTEGLIGPDVVAAGPTGQRTYELVLRR